MSNHPSAKTFFGHYKVVSKIGAGGMGEVFLAEDSRLERKVALKILPEKFKVDAEHLNRFVQEAKAASALNHPNILTVYEIGEADGTNFIASEYIEGKTLREVLEAGSLTLDDALSIITQTAEALVAAHAAGIVHRDIKPENIMVRADGYVKVLDFGLAKLTEKGKPESDGEEATQKLVRTNPGVVLGTAHYMSPEQARGLEIDRRSDVFSFGVVMYEMLTGKLPFTGETLTDVLTALLHTEPAPLKTLLTSAPPELGRIVHKTLKKKRDQRYNSTKDLLGDLMELRQELLLAAKLEQSAAPNEIVRGKNLNLPLQSKGQTKISSSSGSSKDALLLTELENLTGEAVFDAALKPALAFSLEQSPFLQIFADSKVAATLRLMGRSPDERVTKALGHEICQRQGLKAYITGTIALLGTTYLLTLEAVNSRTGEIIGRQFEPAESKEQVLKALGRAASALRENLGESLSSIEKFDAPLEEATTSSLEALRFYLMGKDHIAKGKTFEAIPYYKKAIELDPNFASVYSGLAIMYFNTNQTQQAIESAIKALELCERVNEYEKFRITFIHYSFVTQEIDKAIETLELWKETYPRSDIPLTNLADCLERIGQSEKAVAVMREGLRLDSNHATSHLNLAESLLSLSRFTEVKEVCQEAFSKKMDGDGFHFFLYIVAFIEHDEPAMAEHLAWFGGRADEYRALDLQTGTAAFRGQWRKSQEFLRRAVDMASRRDAREMAATFAAEQALRIALWNSPISRPSGNDERLKLVLKTQANHALRLERASGTLWRTALAFALAGQKPEADALVEELQSQRPKATLPNQLWIPVIEATLKLQSNRCEEALEELEISESFENAGEFFPQYIRGLTYLRLNKSKKAAAEFDKILNHRGEAPLSTIYPLAQLAKARATKDKTEYEKFFDLWKDADKDMPALTEAQKEYEILTS